MKASEIRQKYLDFFVEKGHMIEPSAPLVPIDDDSLLWINSGVATLKKYFDGRETPKKPRIVNSQKAIRTNDIENVGFTARHHTFFEMLGNFSIGDYFKHEAIEFAWEFLTSDKWMGMEPEKLYVTIHPEDTEAFRIWHEDIGLEESRIIRIEGNFWDIGEGPSGPNTEIFYDRGSAYGKDDPAEEMYPGGENERYLEVWNLVFSEFNHNKDNTYTPLPNKNIDTGMGLERMTSISQNVRTNYETDLFMPIIKEVEHVSGKKYLIDDAQDVAFKVIADHIRTISFAIADGALPANEGRGYVLRRLLRRAVRFSQSLGINEPFMYKLVDIVADIMEPYYPNVKDKSNFIKRVIKSEEERFHETLEEGLTILNELIKEAKNSDQVIKGHDAFKLYDTYGFPWELTEEIASERGFTIDHEGFEAAMKEQRERAREARVKEEQERFDKLLNMRGSENAYKLHRELGEIMTANVTVVRENEKLLETDKKIQELMKRYEDIDMEDTQTWSNQAVFFTRQLWNMLVLARVITIGAYNRNESRGAHYKPEFPERNDEEWLKTTMARYKGRSEKPEFTYEPVDVSLIPPRKRDYTSKSKGGNK